MLTVEERQEIVAAFAPVEEMTRGVAGKGLDGALRVAIERENSLRKFWEALNACTDWGLPPAARVLTIHGEPAGSL